MFARGADAVYDIAPKLKPTVLAGSREFATQSALEFRCVLTSPVTPAGGTSRLGSFLTLLLPSQNQVEVA